MRQNARRVDVEDEFGEDIVAFGSLQLNRTRRIHYGGWWREASPCCFGNAEKSGRRNFTPVYASLPHAPHTNVFREPSRIGKHFIEVRS
jgi:hypothetical protein